jgi:hypothetical protein
MLCRVQTLLHKLPKSMSAAWQLGRLASRIEASQGAQQDMPPHHILLLSSSGTVLL